MFFNPLLALFSAFIVSLFVFSNEIISFLTPDFYVILAVLSVIFYVYTTGHQVLYSFYRLQYVRHKRMVRRLSFANLRYLSVSSEYFSRFSPDIRLNLNLIFSYFISKKLKIEENLFSSLDTLTNTLLAAVLLQEFNNYLVSFKTFLYSTYDEITSIFLSVPYQKDITNFGELHEALDTVADVLISDVSTDDIEVDEVIEDTSLEELFASIGYEEMVIEQEAWLEAFTRETLRLEDIVFGPKHA